MSRWPAQNEQPQPCPTCGKIPKLKERWFHDGCEFARGTVYVTRWYACRRWFGLRLCRKGPEHTNMKDWADLAQRCAAQKWNEQINGETK